MYSIQVNRLVNNYKNRKRTGIRYYPGYNLLVKETDFLFVNSSVGERFWYVLNNTKDTPRCAGDNCTNKISKWYDNISYYATYCSTKCVANSKVVRDKFKQTCLKNHGVENPLQSEEVKEKSKRTCLKNLGVENPSQSKEVKEKKRRTCLNNLGFENPSQSEEVKEKVRQTCLANFGETSYSKTVEYKEKIKQASLVNFGFESQFQSDEVKEKIKQTCLKKYGETSYSKTNEYKEKVKQTCLANFGETSYSKTNEYKEKFKQTCLKNHGVENPLQSEEVKEKSKQTNLKNHDGKFACQQHISKDNLNKLKNKNWLIYQHHILKKTLTQIAKELELANCSSVAHYFEKYNIKVLTFSTSIAEQELVTYIKSIYSGRIENPNRKVIYPKHLDIYLPSINLAFEFNGLHYHSTEQIINSPITPKTKNYHFDKFNLCYNKNINLIHIFENKWRDECGSTKYWIKKYINQDNDFITKDLLISNLNNQKELNLSLNWPININKLEELDYKYVSRLEPVEQLLTVDNYSFYKIYDCGKVIYNTSI